MEGTEKDILFEDSDENKTVLEFNFLDRFSLRFC